MKITFKDVGQGDSIIIEWQSSNKIGIIDCCKKGGINPIILHLKKLNIKEIEFIILSHPHIDHYSGLLELLDFIEKRGITVNLFSQTLMLSGTNYWKYFEVNNTDSRLLKKIIKKTKELKVSGLIKKNDTLIDGKIIPLDDNIFLECLAPCTDDIEQYHYNVKLDADKNNLKASQSANLLSTVFKLKIDNTYILLTSDAENTALRGIIKYHSSKFKNSIFNICQLPHHGSALNHLNVFWDIIEKQDKIHAVISAGKHEKYNHPSYSVISDFQQKGYTIHCTNIVNGMYKYTESLSLKLDGCSKLAEEYLKSNDRVFELINGEFELVN